MTTFLRRQPILAAFIFVTAAVLAYRLFYWLSIERLALIYPYGLDYSEGLVWEMTKRMLTPAAYGDTSHMPAIIFPYPPLYYLAARAVAWASGADLLASGRFVSFACSLLIIALTGLIAFETTRDPRTGRGDRVAAVIACMLLAAAPPFVDWAPLMRVDMLSLALGLSAVLLALRAGQRVWPLLIAGLLFVAAFYAKQAAVAAPFCILLVMLPRRPAAALLVFAVAAAVAAATLALLMLATHDRFLDHVVRGLAADFSLKYLYWKLRLWLTDAFPLAFLLAGLAYLMLLRVRFARNGESRPTPMARDFLLVYPVVTGLTSLSVGRVGGTANYFLEFYFASCLLIAFLLAELRRSPHRRAQFGLLAALAVVALQAGTARYLYRNFLSDAARNADTTENANIVAMLKDLDGPVIGDDMVLILRSGHDVLLEPGTYAQLTSLGRWDRKPLIRQIEAHCYAGFLTYGGALDFGLPRFDDETNAAIQRNYPREVDFPHNRLWLPEGPVNKSCGL